MSRPRRALAVVGRWLLGTGLVTWRYIWETTPLHRAECRGDEEDRPPQLRRDAIDDRVLLVSDGYGPMFHRRFRVCIAEADLDPRQLMDRVVRDFEHFVPSEVVAVHVGEAGTGGGPDVGDELLVEMPGPWNGPVRIANRDNASLTLVTLRGHLEAGQVCFRARDDGDLLVFEIELWARSSGRLTHLLYTHLRLSKEVQLNMWVRFCLAAVTTSGGRLVDGVHISTRWLAETTKDVDGQRSRPIRT
ncbi:DUF1990 domain-containing protein [Amycolatopsis taiwanensis]|uniref:DUF1990 domain-containing protein n=1 Tax=Amycolatopsis taiwanensis TaxID=342230 RepID=A0A9W6VGN5_9PSEU|nr:DUF1990 domain-containing protein [Amycolatopsis taiwanensis]GLY67940.1 hypothetical protein Atai01_45590 [Amycolatopsis taiwanensis]